MLLRERGVRSRDVIVKIWRIQTVANTDALPAPAISHPAPVRAAVAPDAIAPDGSEVRYLLGTPNGSTRASLVEITIQAGQVSRPVRHRTVEEAWYLLEGHGRVWRQAPNDTPGTTDTVGPGDTLAIPLGWAFQFAANDDEAMRFLCVTMPPWPGADEAVPVAEGGLGAPTV
jgi:mannose-6-phosphate isomerase-like protein (cupin superfamily)